ncbi:hypothetical protein C8R46DRAFT_891456 [Mycena filopes]|nr:hypothetical protein C8R46DRAFT_891456 [Mycena filopes]
MHDVGIALPASVLNNSVRTITRLDYPGFKIMDQQREHQLNILPSTESFRHSFENLSQGLLRNLDWKNVFVAGGIILGTLTSIDPSLSKQWEHSDIDIYIYGLSPVDANKKMMDIFDTFRSNIPLHTRTIIVKNSKTVTLYANYPLRRIQIVLKLVKSPRDVLLNFDLDICAMGWDGSSVWMLPRAARALETGFNTFTMSLIQGHYLSDRRASKGQRLFKYAARGYGIRILPSYMKSLGIDHSSNRPSLYILAEEARILTQNRYLLLRELGSVYFAPSNLLNVDAAGHSILSSFSSLMCHVAFWEMAQSEDTMLPQVLFTLFTQKLLTNLCRYPWDKNFSPAKLKSYIIQSNLEDIDEWMGSDLESRLQRHGLRSGDELLPAQRMTSASNMKEMLSSQNDLRMPLLLPINFVAYANQLVNKAQTDSGLKETKFLEAVVPRLDIVSANDMADPEGLFWWSIGSDLMWQKQDRRIDEVFEVLYAFRRANQNLDKASQFERLTKELGRHKPSMTPHDEFEGFSAWVGT